LHALYSFIDALPWQLAFGEALGGLRLRVLAPLPQPRLWWGTAQPGGSSGRTSLSILREVVAEVPVEVLAPTMLR